MAGIEATDISDIKRLRSERGVTLWGMAVNIALTAGKIAVGITARSSAIIADGLHSGSDLASDLAVLWSIRAARRPADEDHHYGHARYEAIVTMFVGILLVAAALVVAGEAIITIGQQHGNIRNWWPLWMALASIVLKELLFWWTRAVGHRYRNSAIVANAWHHRSDAFSSVAAAAGI
ncbi:MAG: cation diffusion facilitator family transporter, partial [candidate division WOR-3 bacterium]